MYWRTWVSLCLALGCPRGSDVAGAPDGAGGLITGAGGSGLATSSSFSAGGAPAASSSASGGATDNGGEGGVGCEDAGPGEPNDSEGSAYALDPISDCDEDGSSVSGTVAPGDVDWFFYDGDDTAGCQVDATRTLTTGGPLRICKFVECVTGLDDTDISCPAGTSAATSPEGRPGCCSDSVLVLKGDLLGDDIDCVSTTDDHVLVYLRVDSTQSDACDAYTLTYHY